MIKNSKLKENMSNIKLTNQIFYDIILTNSNSQQDITRNYNFERSKSENKNYK